MGTHKSSDVESEFGPPTRSTQSKSRASKTSVALADGTAIEVVATGFEKFLLVPHKVLTDRGIKPRDFMAHLASMSLGSYSLRADDESSSETQPTMEPTGLLFINASETSDAAKSYLQTITQNTPAPSFAAPWTVRSEIPWKSEFPIPVAELNLEKDQSRRIEGRICMLPTTGVKKGGKTENDLIKFRYFDYSFLPAAWRGDTSLRPIDSVDSVRCYLTKKMAKGISRGVRRRYTEVDGTDGLSSFLSMSGL
jgi:hypothetical protein